MCVKEVGYLHERARKNEEEKTVWGKPMESMLSRCRGVFIPLCAGADRDRRKRYERVRVKSSDVLVKEGAIVAEQ